MSLTYTAVTGNPDIMKGTASTGSEAGAFGASDGLDLGNLDAVRAHVEASTGTFSAGTLDFEIQNPVTGVWAPCPTMQEAVTVGGVAQCTEAMVVPDNAGRIAARPTGLGVACVIYLVGSRK